MKRDISLLAIITIFTAFFMIWAPTIYVNHPNGIQGLYLTHFYQFILYLSPSIFCLLIGLIFIKRITSNKLFRESFFSVYNLILLSVLLSSFIGGILNPEVYKSAWWYIFEYIGTIFSILFVYFLGIIIISEKINKK